MIENELKMIMSKNGEGIWKANARGAGAWDPNGYDTKQVGIIL